MYVDFEILNPASRTTAGIEIVSIVNQYLGEITSDRITPTFYLVDKISLKGEKGQYYTIPKGCAYDVLDPSAKLYVAVTKGNTTILEKTEFAEGLKFRIDEFGKYSLKFIVQDGNNKREKEFSYQISVYDYGQPTLKIVGKKQTLVALGKDIVPATAETNGELTIFVIAPDGKIHKVEDTFKATLKGSYRVMYYATNQFNVTTVESYSVEVR